MEEVVANRLVVDDASVLVVDDSRVSAMKLAKAMTALGHRVETVFDGRSAVDLIRNRSFDVILLDIVMPEMDGYEVLALLKSDPDLRDLPVIVISALEDEAGSVARALELGAEDFLPKDFDLAILKARLKSSLIKKRYRDRELEYLHDVETLTKAAQVIEAGAFRPSELEIDDVAVRNDQLGRLANVFRGLAQAIYDRERRMDRRTRTLWGTIMVIVAGSLFAIGPSLSRLGAELGATAFGLAVWSNVVGAVVCLAIGAARTGFPRLRLAHMRFYLLWALVYGCLYKLWLVVVAENVEATVIALVASSRAFMVFALAALIALERPNLRRLLGLGIGFAAVAVVLISRGADAQGTAAIWLLAALGLPALLAVHTLLMVWRPREIDAFITTGIMLTISVFFLIPVAVYTDRLFLPDQSFSRLNVIIVVFGVATAIAVALALDLVARAGAVFASQMSYIQTLAGIAWGMLLLNEELSYVAWGALALVVLGFLLVQPKQAGDEFSVTILIDPPDHRQDPAA